MGSNSFSFLLSQTPGAEGSKIVLGGINPDYAESPMKYYPLSDPKYWKIALDSLSVGENVTKNLHAIVDTGTSVI